MVPDEPVRAESIPRPLIIGVGNRDRGDDGIGPMAAQMFDRRWPGRAEILVAEGDLSDLLLRWKADQLVVIVDAVMSGQPAGTITTIDGLSKQLPDAEPMMSSHGVGVAEVIALAQVLRRQPRTIAIVGVEASQCEHFTDLSEPVAQALPAVVERMGQLVDGLVFDATRRSATSGPPPLPEPSSIRRQSG